MSGIRGTDTAPELLLRKGLHRLGFRFRLHERRLPGKPDLVFPKFRAALFAHGCFWHGHNCPLFKWPSTREAFWKDKIEGNRIRDGHNAEALRHLGWRVGCVWECAMKGRNRLEPEAVLRSCARWIRGTQTHLEIRGHE
jgi:DNA mismatch endonuclease (patch repair protein)